MAADSTLQAIYTKVRRLTRSPSTSQLSDADLNNYINTFILYDLPEHVRLFDLRTTLKFYCEPYRDVYETNTTDSTSPLFNFKNRYITIHPPVYVSGFEIYLSQNREQFYGMFPFLYSIQGIGTGDGATFNFSGTLPTGGPMLLNNVIFNSIDATNNSITLIDNPHSPFDGLGDLIIPNDTSTGYGFINYITGAYSISFPATPGVNQPINSQTVPYVASQPTAILYYDDKFTLRPVPDQAYAIEMDVYIRPTELLETTQTPQLEQWWQYIAYGAAKKIFEDRMDLESVELIMPEFKQQELLVLRKTNGQYSNDRVATIYAQQVDGNWSGYGGWFIPW